MFRNTSDYDFVVEELECYVTSEYLYNYIKKINQYTNLKFHEIGAATKRWFSICVEKERFPS